MVYYGIRVILIVVGFTNFSCGFDMLEDREDDFNTFSTQTHEIYVRILTARLSSQSGIASPVTFFSCFSFWIPNASLSYLTQVICRSLYRMVSTTSELNRKWAPPKIYSIELICGINLSLNFTGFEKCLQRLTCIQELSKVHRSNQLHAPKFTCIVSWPRGDYDARTRRYDDTTIRNMWQHRHSLLECHDVMASVNDWKPCKERFFAIPVGIKDCGTIV